MNKYIEIAEFLKALSNPKRLEILELLSKKEMYVNDLVKATKIREASVSKNLAILRYIGLVNYRRVGSKVFYRLANSKAVNFVKTINKLNVT
jgi:DNA-binding transcriptional ArsR family regulator